MNKNWRKAVCTKSEVNSKVKFLEGHYYFEKESDHEGMTEVIDENGTTVTFMPTMAVCLRTYGCILPVSFIRPCLCIVT